MRKYLKILLISVAMTQVSCAETFVNWAVGLERWRSGLAEKHVSADGWDFAYLEGGSGPVVLLVHGFGGEKEHWTRFARYLTDHYRVIAVDLPGFGDSTRDVTKSYTPTEQAQRLDAFRQALQIDKLHIVGNSMGGLIAGIYAHDFPAHTRTLTLIDNAGINSPTPSELSRELAAGRNPLLINGPEDMKTLLAFTFVHPPYIPDGLLTKLYQKNAPYRDLNKRIFIDISSRGYILEKMLPAIKAPVLVIWGDQDRVLDVSSTQVIQKLRPDAKVVVLKECGHAPMIEKPEESAGVFLGFVGDLSPSAL